MDLNLGKRKTSQAAARSETANPNKLALGASITMMGTMVGRGLYVLGSVVLARFLGPEAFGLYAIGWTIYRIVRVIGPLGLDQGILRYGSHYRSSDLPRLKGLLMRALLQALLSGLAIGVGLYFLAPWLAEEVYQKPELASVLRWFAPIYCLVVGLRVATSATRVSQRMQYSVYSEQLAQPAVNLCLLLAFFLLGWNLFGAVAALAVSIVISVSMAWYYVWRIFSDTLSGVVEAIPVGRDFYAFTLVACLASGATVLNATVDRLIIGYFLPASDVGVYQAVAQSSILFAAIVGAFSTIFSPMIADLQQRGETEELGELFKVSTKWGLYMSLPVFLVICLIPGEVIGVLFGSEYKSGSVSLVILAVGQLINVGSGSVGLMMVMSGNQRLWLWTAGLMLPVNIALNVLLIPQLGLSGAALASGISLGGLFVLGLLQVRRSLGIWPYDWRYIKGLLAATCAVGALLALRWVNLGFGPLEVFLSLAISHAVFFFGLALFGLDTEDRELMWSVRDRLGRLGRRPR